MQSSEIKQPENLTLPLTDHLKLLNDHLRLEEIMKVSAMWRDRETIDRKLAEMRDEKATDLKTRIRAAAAELAMDSAHIPLIQAIIEKHVN